jgi:hypothetical protein
MQSAQSAPPRPRGVGDLCLSDLLSKWFGNFDGLHANSPATSLYAVSVVCTVPVERIRQDAWIKGVKGT